MLISKFLLTTRILQTPLCQCNAHLLGACLLEGKPTGGHHHTPGHLMIMGDGGDRKEGRIEWKLEAVYLKFESTWT